MKKLLKLLNPFYAIRVTVYAIRRALRKWLIPIFVVALGLLSVVIVGWTEVKVIIPAGNAGVIYRTFGEGTDLSMVLPEGFNPKLPWNVVVEYDTRLQKHEFVLEVITADLLKSNITVSFQYEVNKDTLPILHKYVGPDYFEKVVLPEVISIARGKISALNRNEAFSTQVLLLQEEISFDADKHIIRRISPPGVAGIRLIRISDVQLIDIQFPQPVQKAIQDKIVESEKLESYEFILKREEKETQRKAIEARGIKGFQDIIQAGLSDNYLRWKGIDATKELAKSQNTKVVIFGQGTTSLPLILGDMDKRELKESDSKGDIKTNAEIKGIRK